jgi:hypothetical protein
MRFVWMILLLVGCSAPTLLDAPVDAFTCPDGAVCASVPDGGGCDPINWRTSCGPGFVCAVDGVCGRECGNGDTVCEQQTVCATTSDCIPPCLVSPPPDMGTDPVVKLDPLPPNTTCAGDGLFTPADPSPQCILPCWWSECTSTRRGYGGWCGFVLDDERVELVRRHFSDPLRVANPLVHHLTVRAIAERLRLRGER